MSKSETYLVTGGAGFIGTNLVNSLVQTGIKVIVIDNLVAGNADRLPKEVNFNKVDIRDTKLLTELMKGVDVVIHLAALPRVQYSIEFPQETQEVNVNGTLSVLQAAKSSGVKRVVFAASSAAYGDQEKLPLSPNNPSEPKSPYALHKLMGEQLLKLYSDIFKIETVSLRFFNVYGPHQDPTGPYALVIGKFLQQKREARPLTVTGDGEQTRDFMCLTLLVIKSATTGELERVLNVGYGKQTSINDLVKVIGGDVKYVASRIEPRHTWADITLTKDLLGWDPTISLEEGLSDLLN